MDFLELTGKKILVLGVANRKSVAFHIGGLLTEAGAEVIYSVRSPQRRASLAKLLPQAEIHVCDVEHPEQIFALRDGVVAAHGACTGWSIPLRLPTMGRVRRRFTRRPRRAFLRSLDISCYSLIALAQALQGPFEPSTPRSWRLSISTTRMASENYGFMAPIKAALDSSLVFLAKSFSHFRACGSTPSRPACSRPRPRPAFPATSTPISTPSRPRSANRPSATDEVANVAAFLLSPRSSGINAQRIVVDAGMSVNYFDRELVRRSLDGKPPQP